MQMPQIIGLGSEQSPPLSPLLELLGGDEPGPQVAVAHTLGLPPRRVVLGHHLQDVAALEGKARLLTGRRFVLQRDVVEQGSHVHLPSNTRRLVSVLCTAAN